MKIYHNPKCSKSRQTLALLLDAGEKPEIIEYLKQAPSEKELENLIQKLGVEPEEIVRKGEKLYKEKYKGLSLNRKEWIKTLAENPSLIERPIVVTENKAIIRSFFPSAGNSPPGHFSMVPFFIY